MLSDHFQVRWGFECKFSRANVVVAPWAEILKKNDLNLYWNVFQASGDHLVVRGERHIVQLLEK